MTGHFAAKFTMPMFDFEEDTYERVPRRKAEMYDVDLAIAVSNSLVPVQGAQILTPLEVQRMVLEQIAQIVGNEP